jgi:hypothetical protein
VTEALYLAVAGLTARVAAPDAGVLAAFAERLPPALPARARRGADATWALERVSGGPLLRIRRDGRAGGRARTCEDAVERVVFDVSLFFARRARGLAFFHAGAVAWKGRAILLPGRSFSGKSTLVAALLRAGARYLSDELALVDGAGCVHPWARPLALRRPRGGADRLAPEAFGARAVTGPLSAGAIVFVRHRPAGALRLEPILRGAAALGLLRNALAARSRPGESLRAARAVTAGAVLLRGTRGEADEAARAVLALAGRARIHDLRLNFP